MCGLLTGGHSILLVLNVLQILFTLLPVRHTSLRHLGAEFICLYSRSEHCHPHAVYKHDILEQVFRAVEYLSHGTLRVALTSVTRRLTAILISRFILDLHDTDRAIHGGSSGIRILGSDIGQPQSRRFVSMEMAERSGGSNSSRDTVSG